MIPLPTTYKPMIEVQMRLYKTDGVILLALLLFGEYTEVVFSTYTMATWNLPDMPTGESIYIRQIPCAHDIPITCTPHYTCIHTHSCKREFLK